MTLEVLQVKNETNQAIAKRWRVTEGAVRYHLRGHKRRATDGRKKTRPKYLAFAIEALLQQAAKLTSLPVLPKIRTVCPGEIVKKP